MKKIIVQCSKCGNIIKYKNWIVWILKCPFHWFGKRRIKCKNCGARTYAARVYWKYKEFKTIDKRQEYIDFFTHMQEEDKKSMLGGMAWDNICWWIHDATEKYQLFTKNELADMFPDLLGFLRNK